MQSCIQNSSNKWELIQSKNLDGFNLGFSQLIIINDKEAILFGENDTEESFKQMQVDSSFFLNSNLHIFKTYDNGLTWRKMDFEKGGAWSVCRNGSVIYAATTFKGKKFSKEESILYKSIDNGETWKKVNNYWGSLKILGLDNFENGVVCGIKTDSNDKYGHVYQLQSGKIVKRLDRINHLHNFKFFESEIAYFEQSENENRPYFHDLFCTYNIKTGILKQTILPQNFESFFCYKSEKDYWIVGKVDDKVKIYKQNESLKFELVTTIDLKIYCFPEYIYVYKNKIIVIIGVRKSFYTVSRLFYSNDFGNSWNEEILPKPSHFSPFDFTNKGETIIGMGYSGNGNLQIY